MSYNMVVIYYGRDILNGIRKLEDVPLKYHDSIKEWLKDCGWYIADNGELIRILDDGQ